MTVNPLVAARLGDEPVTPWAGAWIAEDVEVIAHGVASRSWVDAGLGAVGAGLDGLALVSDPVGSLLQYGVSWLIEHVRPLSEALDWLAGDPGAVSAQAQTWRDVTMSLTADADEIVRGARWDLTEWSGAAATAYRGWARAREQDLRALSRASGVMADIVDGAGALISAVRLLVRDAVATVVSRLITYAGELLATAGLATPLVVEQVTTLCAAWAAKITRWLKALIASLGRLAEATRRLADLITHLKIRTGHTGQADAYRTPALGTPEYAARRTALAADPAHGGNVLPKGRREADVALDMERRGELLGPITRAPLKGSDAGRSVDGGDFIDAEGVAWDVKAPTDIFPAGPRAGEAMPARTRGRYIGEHVESDIAEELNEGQNVILDTRNLTPQSLADLRCRVESHPEWRGRVRFHS
jgi:hypothetical protein